jgi:hypothetical protein
MILQCTGVKVSHNMGTGGPNPAAGENCLLFSIFDWKKTILRMVLAWWANHSHTPWEYFACIQFLPGAIYAKKWTELIN